MRRVNDGENIKKALSLYNEALEFQMRGDFERAKELYLQSLRIVETPQAHNNLANILKKEGDFESARKHYISALKLDERYTLALLNLGILHIETEQFERAYWTLKTILKMGTDERWRKTALLAYGIACMESGRLEEAYEVFKDMMDEDIPARLGLLDVLQRMERYDEILDIIDELRRKGIKLQELDLLERIVRKKIER